MNYRYINTKYKSFVICGHITDANANYKKSCGYIYGDRIYIYSKNIENYPTFTFTGDKLELHGVEDDYNNDFCIESIKGMDKIMNDIKEVDTNPNISNIISKSSSSWKLEYDENDDPLKRLTKIMIKDFGCEINTAVHTTEERTNITNIKSSIESNSRPLTFKRFVQAAELLGLNLKISLRNSNGDVASYDSETGYNYNNTIDEEIEDE